MGTPTNLPTQADGLQATLAAIARTLLATQEALVALAATAASDEVASLGVGIAATSGVAGQRLSVSDSLITTGNVLAVAAHALTTGSLANFASDSITSGRMLTMTQTTSAFTGDMIGLFGGITGTFSGKFIDCVAGAGFTPEFSVDYTGKVTAAGKSAIAAHGTATGALATTTFATGTAKQLDTTSDRILCLNPALAAGTIEVQLSPDGSTYSALGIFTTTATSSSPITVTVPQGWYVTITLTGSAALTSATYY